MRTLPPREDLRRRRRLDLHPGARRRDPAAARPPARRASSSCSTRTTSGSRSSGASRARMCEASGSDLAGALDGRRRRCARGLGVRRHAAARRRAGGAPPRRARRARVRPDRAGDDRHRRLREGAAHDPRDARDRARGRAQRARRDARQLHEPGRPDHGAAAPPHLAARRRPLQRAVEHADRGRERARLRVRATSTSTTSGSTTCPGRAASASSGEERTAEVLARYRELLVDQAAGDDEPGFAPETIALLGAVPNYYDLYYYETAAMLRHQEQHADARLAGDGDRGAGCSSATRTSRCARSREELMERGGAYYSESAAALMADVHADAGIRAGRQRAQRRRDARACPTTSWSRCLRGSAGSGAIALPTAPAARRPRRARAHGQGLRAAHDRGRAAAATARWRSSR